MVLACAKQVMMLDVLSGEVAKGPDIVTNCVFSFTFMNF